MCIQEKHILSTKEAFVKDLQNFLLSNTKAKANLIKAFRKQQTVVKSDWQDCSVAGWLTKLYRHIANIQDNCSKLSEPFKACKLKKLKIWGRVVITEPYFCDTAYKPVKHYAMPRRSWKVCVG